MRTPWGEAQTVTRTHKPGVVVVETAGHGGVRMTLHATAELTPQAMGVGFSEMGVYWFEEDCAWAAVAYEHPEWFTFVWRKEADELKTIARGTLERWYPEYFGPSVS